MNDIEYQRLLAKARRQGGLSDSVYNQPELQEYISSPYIFGYMGSYYRTKEKDKVVEDQLRRAELTDKEIALWLTSSSARHMMDGSYWGQPKDEFSEMIKPYTQRALLDLENWSES